MYRLAAFEMYREPYRTIDAMLADIDAVTGEDAGAVADEFFDPERQTMVWLGPN
jgi:predicted Zn-dependent peptidase